MRKIIFATGNQGKMREVRMIMENSGWEILSLKDVGVVLNEEENGSTFTENALIKAREAARKTGLIALADDSGLVVDALGGEPGIYSARYLGEDTSYDIKNSVILERMKEIPEQDRTARFVCAIACVMPDGKEMNCEAAMEGRIGYEIAGSNGFGYDPVFFLPQFGCSSAQISPEQKNEISHRGKALRKMKQMLEEELQ